MNKKQSEVLQRAFRSMMLEVATSTPGHILAFDPETQLAQIQIGIVRVTSTGETFEPNPIIEVPVYFSGGGGFILEHKINAGDEGIVLFSQRCIDGWRQTGGIAQNPILRLHDVNDAMFLPGLRSNPNAISDFQNDGIRMRNADGSNYIWLKDDGTAEIKVSSLEVMNDINVTGGDVTADGISLKQHTHPYSWTDPAGNGDTGAAE